MGHESPPGWNFRCAFSTVPNGKWQVWTTESGHTEREDPGQPEWDSLIAYYQPDRCAHSVTSKELPFEQQRRRGPLHIDLAIQRDAFPKAPNTVRVITIMITSESY